MEKLSRMTGETVDLSVLKGDSAVFVDQVLGTHRLVAVSAVGERFPLHCTANGKALLTVMPPARRNSLMAKELDGHTTQTITDREQLLRELKAVQASGVAFDRDEHTMGISAVGTAFVDPMGREYAISVPVPSARFVNTSDDLVAKLLNARNEIVKLVAGNGA
jgi:DNA-binding IclR family transcriptional regulator